MIALYGQHIDIQFLSTGVLMLSVSLKGEGQVCIWKPTTIIRNTLLSSWCDNHIQEILQNDISRNIQESPSHSRSSVHPFTCHWELSEEFQGLFQPFIRHRELCEKPKILMQDLLLPGGQNALHLSMSVLILKTWWKLGQPIFK